jgi:integrase
MIIVCRMVAAYAQKCEYASTDFSAHLSGNYTDSKEIHHPFTHDEIMRLWKDKSQPAARFALVTIYTGLRPSELLGASVSLSDITRGYFTAGSKTEAGRGRIIPIHPDIKPVLMALVMESKGGRLFDAQSLPAFRHKFWDEYMQTACMEHLPHDGRHTCATLMEAAGIPLVRRKLILGHAVADITEGVYTHVKPEELIAEISKIKP